MHKGFKYFDSPKLRDEYTTLKREFTKYVREKYYKYKQSMQQMINDNEIAELFRRFLQSV